MKFCANIYFNKQCIAQKITPAYAKIKVAKTSPASTITQQKAQVMRVKDEIKFLYRKKEHINRELYTLHLKAATEWGTLWDILSKIVHDSTRHLMNNKYRTMDLKLKRLAQTLKKLDAQTHTFFPRIMNKTNITLIQEEDWTHAETRTISTEIIHKVEVEYNLHGHLTLVQCDCVLCPLLFLLIQKVTDFRALCVQQFVSN
jgi:hypothetical protein